jgi:hypothetical protein
MTRGESPCSCRIWLSSAKRWSSLSAHNLTLRYAAVPPMDALEGQQRLKARFRQVSPLPQVAVASWGASG